MDPVLKTGFRFFLFFKALKKVENGVKIGFFQEIAGSGM